MGKEVIAKAISSNWYPKCGLFCCNKKNLSHIFINTTILLQFDQTCMNQNEIEKIWLKYHPKIYGYYFKRLNHREDVEDLTATCLTIFVEKMISSDQKIDKPEAFLWKIIYNQFNEFIRQKYRLPKINQLDDSCDTINIDLIESEISQHYQAKMQEIWQSAKRSCSKQELELLEEVYLKGSRSSDLAKKWNLKPDNVRQRLKRAVDKLKKLKISLWN